MSLKKSNSNQVITKQFQKRGKNGELECCSNCFDWLFLCKWRQRYNNHESYKRALGTSMDVEYDGIEIWCKSIDWNWRYIRSFECFTSTWCSVSVTIFSAKCARVLRTTWHRIVIVSMNKIKIICLDFIHTQRNGWKQPIWLKQQKYFSSLQKFSQF